MKVIFQKIYSIFLISMLLFHPICFADDYIEEIDEDDTVEVATKITTEPQIFSKHVVAIDRKTNMVLYEKDAYAQTPMASTTKIMTCILALEHAKLDEMVTISSQAANIHGSTLGIQANMQISMLDLLYGLMLRSGNDCAIAIAEHISGSVEAFADLMNEKAKELNLTHTHFVTPHGLDDDNHYTTAYELALLTNYALENETFRNIVSTKQCTISLNGSPKNLINTNELLGNLNGVYGVKTGFTFHAGRCLVTSCKTDALDIIVVVLGADTKKMRTSDSRNLIQYILQEYQYYNTYPLLEKNFQDYISYFEKHVILEKTADFPVIAFSTLDNYVFPLSKNDVYHLSSKIYTIPTFSSKISKDEKVGYITLYANDKALYSLDIIMQNELQPHSWKYYYTFILKNYFHSIFFK